MLKSQKAVITDGGMNSEGQQQVQKETDCELNLNREWVMQMDNNPKCISHSAKEMVKEE